MFERWSKAVAWVRNGNCPCPGCYGELTDPHRSPRRWGHCRRCGCAWRTVSYGERVYPVSILGLRCALWTNVADVEGGWGPERERHPRPQDYTPGGRLRNWH